VLTHRKEAASKAHYARKPTAKIESSPACYAKYAYRRARYVLAEPNHDVQELYMKEIPYFC